MKIPRFIKRVRKRNYYPEPVWLKAMPFIQLAIEIPKLQKEIFTSRMPTHEDLLVAQYQEFLENKTPDEKIEYPFIRWLIEQHVVKPFLLVAEKRLCGIADDGIASLQNFSLS